MLQRRHRAVPVAVPQIERSLLCLQADKRFQLADWRARPLNEEMLAYARADTHYLLYCYDKLKVGCCARWLRSLQGGCTHCKEGAVSGRGAATPGGCGVYYCCLLSNPPHLATLAVQAALKDLGDKVPDHLKVELPLGAEAAKQATGSAALATVLERSRRHVVASRQGAVVGLASAGAWAASACGWQPAALKRQLGQLDKQPHIALAAPLSPTKQAVPAAVREGDLHLHCLHGAVQQVERHAER